MHFVLSTELGEYRPVSLSQWTTVWRSQICISSALFDPRFHLCPGKLTELDWKPFLSLLLLLIDQGKCRFSHESDEAAVGKCKFGNKCHDLQQVVGFISFRNADRVALNTCKTEFYIA